MTFANHAPGFAMPPQERIDLAYLGDKTPRLDGQAAACMPAIDPARLGMGFRIKCRPARRPRNDDV